MFRNARINFGALPAAAVHGDWIVREAAAATTKLAAEWAAAEVQTTTLLDAPSLLECVAEEISRIGTGASRHAHGRHCVLTLLARACGDPGGHEHNCARTALHTFVRDCGEDGIREWADHNDAPTLIVGLRACAALLRGERATAPSASGHLPTNCRG